MCNSILFQNIYCPIKKLNAASLQYCAAVMELTEGRLDAEGSQEFKEPTEQPI